MSGRASVFSLLLVLALFGGVAVLFMSGDVAPTDYASVAEPSPTRPQRGEAAFGVFDVAPNESQALRMLANELAEQVWAQKGVGPRSLGRGLLQVVHSGEDGNVKKDAARRFSSYARKRGFDIDHTYNTGNYRVDLTIEEDSAHGPMYTLRTSHGHRARVVREMPVELNDGMRIQPDQIRVRLKTMPWDDEQYAIEDAQEVLDQRLREEVFRRARGHGWVDSDDHYEFTRRLGDLYKRETLLAQGKWRVVTDVSGDDGRSEFIAYADWVGHKRNLDRIADGIASRMNAEDRLPLIRVGLSIGVILFAFLAWLRVDWWLKGHYSFLTKLTFGIVLIIGVGLIWSGAVEWLLVM